MILRAAIRRRANDVVGEALAGIALVDGENAPVDPVQPGWPGGEHGAWCATGSCWRAWGGPGGRPVAPGTLICSIATPKARARGEAEPVAPLSRRSPVGLKTPTTLGIAGKIRH